LKLSKKIKNEPIKDEPVKDEVTDSWGTIKKI